LINQKGRRKEAEGETMVNRKLKMETNQNIINQNMRH
jgi:hypothetical protein